MPNVSLIRSDALAETPGYAYASSVAPGTRLIHLAGACPLDADGTVGPVGDYAGQAAKCIENLLSALGAAGAELSDVAYTRVLVATTQNEDLGTVWNVVRAAFAEHEVPSTLFGVTVLGYWNQLVEIEAVAAVADTP
ncbi:RidA family protein [Gryllotalpicola koreensis]|uniref:RidA family protein n=1 Tax=Gryllotalpicola koreensis TaxID=993086 RepID=A0ABP7ZYZ6_9MICO